MAVRGCFVAPTTATRPIPMMLVIPVLGAQMVAASMRSGRCPRMATRPQTPRFPLIRADSPVRDLDPSIAEGGVSDVTFGGVSVAFRAISTPLAASLAADGGGGSIHNRYNGTALTGFVSRFYRRNYPFCPSWRFSNG